MNHREFRPKKLPTQARARHTFDAIVEACARLLIARGYGALTTNHIAEVAGVSIGSVYEWFGDKESVVSEVVRRASEGFSEDAARALPALEGMALEDAVKAWIDALLSAMRARAELLRAIASEVPLAIREPHRRDAWVRHLSLARAAYRSAGDQVRQDRVEEVSFLVVTLVDGALTRLVLEPPEDVDEAVVVEELGRRVVEWVAPRKVKQRGR